MIVEETDPMSIILSLYSKEGNISLIFIKFPKESLLIFPFITIIFIQKVFVNIVLT